ncbi:MAG: polysaccharide deacetylase family protein [Candidatus Omnitrophica bacterium]|nr:polysaccharide deacetylase family protein [Candidatus Omnitrophota bacterium]
MYHHIDEYSEQSKLSVSPESFEKQMKFLREHRYNIVSLDELAELIKSKKSLPHKTIVVTFDDGYKDNYTEAFPALKKYNIPAAVFVAANKVGREGYMDWQELEEMVSYGVGVGSHTLSECYLPDIKDKTKLRKEIYGSREIIRSKLPQEASFIAYCSGGFNEKIRQMVIDAGYTGACATNPGKDYPDDDIFALKRVRISRTSDNLFVFWIESSGFYTWLKEIRDED